MENSTFQQGDVDKSVEKRIEAFWTVDKPVENEKPVDNFVENNPTRENEIFFLLHFLSEQPGVILITDKTLQFASAEIAPYFVVILGGREPAFVLRLVWRNFCSPLG